MPITTKVMISVSSVEMQRIVEGEIRKRYAGTILEIEGFSFRAMGDAFVQVTAKIDVPDSSQVVTVAPSPRSARAIDVPP